MAKDYAAVVTDWVNRTYCEPVWGWDLRINELCADAVAKAAPTNAGEVYLRLEEFLTQVAASPVCAGVPFPRHPEEHAELYEMNRCQVEYIFHLERPWRRFKPADPDCVAEAVTLYIRDEAIEAAEALLTDFADLERLLARLEAEEEN